jgi:integrase
VSRSRGTVRHLCRDGQGRPLKRTRHGDGTVSKHAGGCKNKNANWAYGVRVAPGRYLRRGGFTSEQEAAAALDEVRKKFAQGIDPTVRPPTVDEWMTTWLAEREFTRGRRPVRPQSHARLRGVVDRHVRPHLGHLRLDALRQDDVQAMFHAIRRANETAERPVGLGMQNAVMSTLRSALDMAVRDGKLLRNPLGNFGVEPYRPPERGVWTVAQRDAFLDRAHADGERLAAAFELIALYGLRRNEVLGLRWQDIEDGRLHVRQQLGGGPPKTDSSRRSFRLDAGTLAVLRDHRRRQLEERMRFPDSPHWQLDLVFARPDGSPVGEWSLERSWKRIAQRAGVPRLTLHEGRHTAITLGLAGGVPLKVMSERAGHASTRITADLYAHVLDEHDAAAAELIGSLRTRRELGG